MSSELPAANGIIARIGRAGQACANAACGSAGTANAAAADVRNRRRVCHRHFSRAVLFGDEAQAGGTRHLVHLHAERDRCVVADQYQHLGDAVAADGPLDLGELGVRQLRAGDQRRGKAVHGALVRIGELGIAAGENRVDDLLRQSHLLAHLDVSLTHVVGVPMLRDHQDADLDLRSDSEPFLFR